MLGLSRPETSILVGDRGPSRFGDEEFVGVAKY